MCDAGIVSRVGMKHIINAGAESVRGTETKIVNASHVCSARLLNACTILTIGVDVEAKLCAMYPTQSAAMISAALDKPSGAAYSTLRSS